MPQPLVLSIFLLACTAVFAPPAIATESSASSVAETATMPAPMPVTVSVRMQTELGDIVVAVEQERAPLTAANFLRYVDQKRLDGALFYRAMKIGDSGELGLVQGGLRGDPKRVLKPIAHESTLVTGLSHVSGAISMARAAPGTANADFFFMIGDLTTLDARPADAATGQAEEPGYAVFGRVSEGMDVVRALLEQPISATLGPEVMKGQMIEKPVKILTVRRVR